jgi:hypothetical protein
MGSPYAIPKDIRDQLEASVPELRSVLIGDEARDHLDAAAPVAVVVLASRTVSKSLRGGQVTLGTVTFGVWVGIDNDHSAEARDEGASVIGACQKVLLGFRPENATSSLYEVSPPAPRYGEGRTYYPLTLECSYRTEAP